MTAVQWLIARRYLFSRERKALISMISLISVGGVAVGVAALLIVIGVIDGIDAQLFGSFVNLYPHVRIRSADGGPLRVEQALIDRLNARSDVELAQPVIEKEAFIQNKVRDQVARHGIHLIGVSELGPGTLYPSIPDARTGGRFKLDEGTILVGRPLFYNLGLIAGTPIQVITTSVVRTAIYNTLRTRNLTIAGQFNADAGLPESEFDAVTAFVSDNQIREMYHMPPGTTDYIHVKLKNPYAADRVKHALGLSADRYKVTTWSEENSDFFGALKLEKLGLWLILLLIILVAALNIVGTLILMVIEKTREVGILRAIGASERMVSCIFLMDGLMIGLVGTLVGLAIGIGVCLAIPHINIPLPEAVIFNHLPVKIRPLTVSMVIAASMAICTLAALFPAWQASRLNPVEALRYD